MAFADGRAESPLEPVGRWRLHRAELPAPELQVVLGNEYGPLGRVDFYWPEYRTVGEADGLLEYRAGADGRPDFARACLRRTRSRPRLSVPTASQGRPPRRPRRTSTRLGALVRPYHLMFGLRTAVQTDKRGGSPR